MNLVWAICSPSPGWITRYTRLVYIGWIFMSNYFLFQPHKVNLFTTTLSFLSGYLPLSLFLKPPPLFLIFFFKFLSLFFYVYCKLQTWNYNYDLPCRCQWLAPPEEAAYATKLVEEYCQDTLYPVPHVNIGVHHKFSTIFKHSIQLLTISNIIVNMGFTFLLLSKFLY